MTHTVRMTRDLGDDDGFFEEDEPIEDILAILARGADGLTGPPGAVPVVPASAAIDGNRSEPARRAS